MRQIVTILAIVCALAAAAAASATTASQKLRKSESVVAWYQGEGHWHLRPGYRFCADLKSPRASGRCWRHRENLRWHRARVHRLTPKPMVLSPASAIRVTFGVYAGQAIAVASCESGLRTWAQNGQYLGMFQMGDYARSRYGHGSDALTQARAAYRYFVDSGRGWSPWECKP